MGKKILGILAFLTILSFLQLDSIYSFTKDTKENFLKEADLYYVQQRWDKAIWYYRNYLESNKKNNVIHYDILYKIANIYYDKLKRYYYALKIYKELEGKFNKEINEIISAKIKELDANRDNDLFNYAIEHDLSLSDNQNLFIEVDKVAPENSSITYKYIRGFDGKVEAFKILQSGKQVRIVDNNEKIFSSMTFEDFIKLWVELMLLTWYDIPEDNAVITNFTQKDLESLSIRAPTLISDSSSIEIIVFENNTLKKLIRADALEIASEAISNINNYFEKLKAKQ